MKSKKPVADTPKRAAMEAVKSLTAKAACIDLTTLEGVGRANKILYLFAEACSTIGVPANEYVEIISSESISKALESIGARGEESKESILQYNAGGFLDEWISKKMHELPFQVAMLQYCVLFLADIMGRASEAQLRKGVISDLQQMQEECSLDEKHSATLEWAIDTLIANDKTTTVEAIAGADGIAFDKTRKLRLNVWRGIRRLHTLKLVISMAASKYDLPEYAILGNRVDSCLQSMDGVIMPLNILLELAASRIKDADIRTDSAKQFATFPTSTELLPLPGSMDEIATLRFIDDGLSLDGVADTLFGKEFA